MRLKTIAVDIGEIEFTLQELTCENRDVFIELLGTVQLPSVISLVMNELGKLLEEDKDKKLGKADIFSLFTFKSDLWGKIISSIVESVGVLSQAIVLSVKDLNDKDSEYILKNLTARQEAEILPKLIQINDISNIVKNYKSLLIGAKSLLNLRKK